MSLTCYHCATQITKAQPRLIIRPPRYSPAAFWTTYHADCYVRAEELAALALGILPEHMQDALIEAKTRAALAQGAQACA